MSKFVKKVNLPFLYQPNYERDIVEEMKQAESCGDFVYVPDASKVIYLNLLYSKRYGGNQK